MNASPDELFKTMKPNRRPKEFLLNFAEHATSTEKESWANYFQNLATPKNHPHFDNEHWKYIKLKHELLKSSANHEHTTTTKAEEESTTTTVKELKNNKAADISGISAEHIKEADPIILDILTTLTNRVLASGEIPECIKHGAVTPVLKKRKPPKQPDSCRRITVTSMVGKIIEKEILKQTEKINQNMKSKLQFGFTKNVSPLISAMLITEAICHAHNNKKDLIITFMDASKAFDLVCHPGLLNKLHNQGITGNLWNIYNNMYTNVTAQIKWKGELSSTIYDKQGLRQGASTSAEVFNRRNDLLHQISKIDRGMKIGTEPVSAVMVADDLALLDTSHENMKLSIKLAQRHANKERYIFSETKTSVVHIPVATKRKAQTNLNPTPSLSLNNKKIQTSQEEVHLGIQRSTKITNTTVIQARITSARRTAYSLFGAGFHGINGVGTEVIHKQWTSCVRPVLTYGLEALILDVKELEVIETFARSMLKRLQSLPNSTANQATYLLFGTLPIEATIHSQILSMLGNIIRRPGSTENNIVRRQTAMYKQNQKIWINQAKSILSKYELPSIYELLETKPKKLQWKKQVKRAILEHWTNTLENQAKSMKSLSYLNLEACSLSKPHHVWGKSLSNPKSVIRTAVHAQLLTLRYPLTGYKHAGRNFSKLCPLCNQEEEEIEHFLLRCPLLKESRDQSMKKMLHTLNQTDSSNMASIILDPSFATTDKNTMQIVQTLSRNLCYNLHLQRKKLLALSSCSNNLPLKYAQKRPALSDYSNKQTKRTCRNITATQPVQL